MSEIAQELARLPLGQTYGRVIGAAGLVVKVQGLQEAALGARCRISDVRGLHGPETRLAEVVGHQDGQTMLMPFGSLDGVGPGCRVYAERAQASIRVNQSWLGRIVSPLGEPLDGKGPLAGIGGEERMLKANPPPAGIRRMVGPKMDTGVRVLNTMLPLCDGQRLGIFAGSGVGKSVLMGMLAQYSQAEITVIGLIGERGKEVREFIEEQLGEEGARRSVVVVATGDEPPLVRRQAAYTTMAVAEYFRDCGFKVLLMMDSVTRFALAQREIGLASGEPPTTRGFTPSVFAELPRLLERAGPGPDLSLSGGDAHAMGSISAIFTVLVEGGDLDEPVADAVRGILDGHIVLTRAMAERGHFPAIDVLKSVSRMVPKCLSADEWRLVQQTRQTLAVYNDMAELIRLGAYQQGTDPQVDRAIQLMPQLEQFLRQAPSEKTTMPEAFAMLGNALGQ